MGSSAPVLPGIDLPTIRKGPFIDGSAGINLCAPVTTDEIDQALFSIADDKAPGIDGFNAVFLKKLGI